MTAATKTAKDLLIEARAVIEDPQNWITGHYAQDRTGRSVAEWSAQACKWCAKGALYKVIYGTRDGFVTSVEENGRAHNALDAAALVLKGHDSIIALNDREGHMAVLEAYNHAIEAQG